MQLRNCVLAGAFLSFLLPLAAFAQDERRVSSPDKQVEFRIFVAPQEERSIIRIAYQVFYRARPLIQTSFLALDIWSQEPLLGESTGLVDSHTDSHPTYNSLTASYMQNGSLGRLLNIEARAYNDGVAFRYVIPRSTPLRELLIADEATEFALPRFVDPPPALPFIAEQPGPVWIEITEIPLPNFPPMHLVPFDGNILLSRLTRRVSNPDIAFEGSTPLTYPWRIIAVAATRTNLINSPILSSLYPGK